MLCRHRLCFSYIFLVGTHNDRDTQPDQAPPLSEAEQKARDKTLSFAKKELKKLGKAGLAEIKRMSEEEKVRLTPSFNVASAETGLGSAL